MTERQREAARDETSELSVCPCCERDLVYPVDWAPAGVLGWNIALRCPECEWQGTGIYPQDVADRFDESLDRSAQLIMDDLELLIKANMEEQVERFSAALAGDLILPEDF